MRKRLKEDILFIGGKFAKMRDKIPHGRWGSYIERNFDLSIKTANIWIRAWENRDSELALSDWSAYMRALYGNELKKLKADYRRPEEIGGDDGGGDDDEQSGGPGFGPGLGRPSLLIKANPAFTGTKTLSPCSTTSSSEVRRSRAKRS